MTAYSCGECGAAIERKRFGPPPTYCSNSCRAKVCTRRAGQTGKKAEWDAALAVRRRANAPRRYCTACGGQIEPGSRRRSACSDECARRNTARRMAPLVQMRRARMAGVDAEAFDSAEVYDRDGWICQLCNTAVDRALRFPDPGAVSLDHVVPLSRGGPHTRANTQCAHFRCNASKGAQVAQTQEVEDGLARTST